MTRKADVAAADRLLKAAVREARKDIALCGAWYGPGDRAAVVNMLTEAGNSAALLLAGDDR